MKFRLLMIPAMVLAVSAGAKADQLQTFDVAKELIYPGKNLIPADFTVGDRAYQRLKVEYKVPSIRPQVKAWKTESGEWLFLDQVYGLNDIVTYILGVDQEGKITGLEILTCAEGFCDGLFTVQWRAQMMEASHGQWAPSDVVPIVSGATLSTTHVADGVKKLLAIHARYLPGTAD